MTNKKAFSLIELSIVVLIIGILIAGVTQASRLIKLVRISNAKTLTESSPVAGIKDLIIWLETSADASLKDSERENGLATISTWNDINPQSVAKFTLTEATNKPTYIEDGINGIPSLKFDGTNDKLVSTTNIGLTGNPSYTFFVVAKVNANSTWAPWINWGSAGAGQWVAFGQHTNADKVFTGFYGGGQHGVVSNFVGTSRIYTWSRVGGGSDRAGNSIYVNGGSVTPVNEGATVTVNLTDSTLKIGSDGTYFTNSDIGEVIIFNRALKVEEISSIHSYLSKKWGIKI